MKYVLRSQCSDTALDMLRAEALVLALATALCPATNRCGAAHADLLVKKALLCLGKPLSHIARDQPLVDNRCA